jgi:hypothetical protein
MDKEQRTIRDLKDALFASRQLTLKVDTRNEALSAEIKRLNLLLEGEDE